MTRPSTSSVPFDEPKNVRFEAHAAWFATAEELSTVVERLGRMPQAGDVAVLPRLLSWVKNQRRAENLTADQVARLNDIRGWSWAPHDDVWDGRYTQLEEFLRTNGRPPRVRSPETSERILGLWTARQRRAARANTMPYVRLIRWRALDVRPGS